MRLFSYQVDLIISITRLSTTYRPTGKIQLLSGNLLRIYEVDMSDYYRYYTVLYSVHPLVTTELGPIVILTTLNILIFNTIMKTKRRLG